MNMNMKQLRAKDLTPRTIVLSLCIFVLATTGIMAVVVKAMTGSAAAGTVNAVRHVDARAPLPSTQVAAGKAIPAPNGQDYTVIVKRNLFHALETIAVAPPPPPVKIVPPPPPPDTGPAPFQTSTATPAPQVAFTGVVDIGGEQYALLESLEDHLSQYTRVGSSAFGYKLVSIGDKAVTVETSGEQLVLNIGDNKQEEAITPPKVATPAPTTTPPGGGRFFNGNGAPNGMGNPNGGFRRRQRDQTTTGEG